MRAGRRTPYVVLAGLGLALLAGCVGNAGSGTYSPTASGGGGSYTVVAGDSLWGIAKAHGVPLQSLIQANQQIPAPYVLQVGQQITIPQSLPSEAAVAANAATPIDGTSYAVQPGDTLYAISRRSGIPVPALAQANALTAPYGLQVGQRLQLPQEARDPALLAARAQPIPAALATPVPVEPVSEPSGPQPVSIAAANAGQPADLLADLESTSKTTPAAAAAAAPAAAAAAAPASLTQVEEVAAVEDSVSVEETPGGETTATVTETAVVAAVATQSGQIQVPPAKPSRDVALPAAAVATSAAAKPAANAALPAPPKREGRLFDWPVTGKVISTHGPKAGGLHNDGINIAAPEGTPVRAAESGVVAYTGGDLKGFGKLVLIKHSDGYVTAYAHNSQILVQRGETVRRGDVIARVGKTGNVDTPQLHFEIRKDAKPVDPAQLMVSVAG